MTDQQKFELKEFVRKWKDKIPEEDIYFSFNGHGHLRYINANNEGLIRFGLKNIEAAISDEKYTDLGGEYPGENWIKEEDEDLSSHYIEKINDNIEEYILSRRKSDNTGKRNRILALTLIVATFIGLIGFMIYLFIFWLHAN